MNPTESNSTLPALLATTLVLLLASVLGCNPKPTSTPPPAMRTFTVNCDPFGEQQIELGRPITGQLRDHLIDHAKKNWSVYWSKLLDEVTDLVQLLDDTPGFDCVASFEKHTFQIEMTCGGSGAGKNNLRFSVRFSETEHPDWPVFDVFFQELEVEHAQFCF